MKVNSSKELEKSYFDVLGLCCSSEVSLIEKILKPLEGVHHVSVILPSRTVIVVHDSILISQIQIVKVLNQARLEANVRVRGNESYRNKWPSPFAVICGVLLLLSFLKYVFPPFKWLALGAVAVGIIPLILKSIASLRNFRLDINILMLIAVGGSIFLKDYWEAGTIVFLLTTSEWLESRASHKATAVMSSLMNIAPQKAVLAETGEEIDANEVMVNTRLAVKAGDMIPIDGTVVEGKSEVDEKALTGESFPVSKQVDSTVWAGTINLNGYISVRTTALAEDCVVARMAKLVEEAQNNKSKTQRYIDKCAKYYTPAVVIVAACLAAIPAALRVHNRNEWYHLALVVLVSACPCALILSTPVASYCALSQAATIGLLVKGAEYLETLSTVKIIAFDKTGTITKGEFSVSNFRSFIDDISLNKLLYWVSSIESKSSHPMAAALVDYAQSRSVEPQPESVEEFENFPGEGIYGKIEGKNIYVGNQKMAIRAGCSTVPRNDSESNDGKSTGYIFLDSSPAGVFSLSDSCRIGVKEALKELKSMGITTAMLTGDCQSAANHAQNQLGDALDMVQAELLPQDKAKMIKEFQKEASTAMVGDGLNDAPALATAGIGISMGVSGSALANETGHVILMSNDIRKIPIAVRLARKTRRKIFENIFLAIVTKAAIIALAIAGHPLVWAAVLADVGTCLVVIFNSMFLLRGTTTSRTTKKHSGSSHNHKHCLSSLKHEKCSSGSEVRDKCKPGNHPSNKCSDQGNNHGCCGHDDKVHVVKHSVQETRDKHSCHAHDNYVHQIKHSVQEIKDAHGCCAHDNHVHQIKPSVQEIEDAHGCCALDNHVHQVKHSVQETEDTNSCHAHDNHVYQVKHSVLESEDKHNCCAHDDDHIHEVPESVQETEENHGGCVHDDQVHEVKHSVKGINDDCCAHDDDDCCAHDDDDDCCAHDEDDCCAHDEDDEVHEGKHKVQLTDSQHGCCAHVDDEGHEVKHVVQATDNKHGCCDHADDEVHKAKQCDKISKDLESQSVQNHKCGNSINQTNHENPHCHSNINTKLHESHGHSHHHHHHHHHNKKDYITEEELGKMVRNCCKSHGLEKCLSLEKRHAGGCCKSFSRHQHFGVGFNGGGSLSEIVIE